MFSVKNLTAQRFVEPKKVKGSNKGEAKERALFAKDQVVIVTNFQNRFRIPIGVSTNLLNSKRKAVVVFPYAIDGELSVQNVKKAYPELYNEIKDAGLAFAGADIVNSIANKSIHPEWPEDMRNNAIASLSKKDNYFLLNLIGVKEFINYKVDKATYDTMSEEEKENYSVKGDAIMVKGITDDHGFFTDAVSYKLLGGNTTITTKEDGKKVANQVVYKVSTNFILTDEGMKLHVLYGATNLEVTARVSKPKVSGVEDTITEVDSEENNIQE